MSILELLFRIIITILVLLIMARLNGPKQISQLNFYDYVVGIAAGSLAASVSIDSSVNILNGLLSIVLYLLSGIFMSWLARKNMTLRRFLSGKPIVLIANGKIQWEGLKRAHMNVNELLSALRYGGYFNIDEINDAIMEPIGKLSVQPKGYARPPKIYDLNIAVAETSLNANVIIDGKILDENLSRFNKDAKWLYAELDKQGVKDIKEIALATLTTKGELSVYLKDYSQSKQTSLI